MKKITPLNGNGRGAYAGKTGKSGNLKPQTNGRPWPILITGGAGFIGTNLADRLLSLGYRVILLDNLSRPGVEKNLRWLIETRGDQVDIEVPDIRNFAAVRSAVNRCSQIFHFAAQVAVTSSLTNPLEDFEINASGTLNLLEAIRAAAEPPPLVFTSTNKVYGGLHDLKLKRYPTRYVPEEPRLRKHGISESRTLDFHSPYGCSKGAADQYVLDYARTFGLPAVVFRMSCIYGPHQFGNQDQGWIAHFLVRSIFDQPITVYGDGLQVRDVLFIDDLIDAFLLAQCNMPALSGEAFNIGGGPENTISLLELLDLISEFHGGCPSIEFAQWREADQRYYVSDTSKFRRLTGWHPRVSVREGVSALYRWLTTELAMVASENQMPMTPELSSVRRIETSECRAEPCAIDQQN